MNYIDLKLRISQDGAETTAGQISRVSEAVDGVGDKAGALAPLKRGFSDNLAVYGMAQANVPVGVGYHYAAAMERGGAASTTTWYANNATNVYISRVAAG